MCGKRGYTLAMAKRNSDLLADISSVLVGHRICLLRYANQMTRADLAHVLECDVDEITRIEHCKCQVCPTMMNKIASFFGVTPEEIVIH